MLILQTESIIKKDITDAIIKTEVIESNLRLHIIGIAGSCQDDLMEKTEQ